MINEINAETCFKRSDCPVCGNELKWSGSTSECCVNTAECSAHYKEVCCFYGRYVIVSGEMFWLEYCECSGNDKATVSIDKAIEKAKKQLVSISNEIVGKNHYLVEAQIEFDIFAYDKSNAEEVALKEIKSALSDFSIQFNKEDIKILVK